jgi:hypothetical protein
MAIVDLDLAIGRARGEAVSIAIESGCFDHVPMTVLQEDETVRFRLGRQLLHGGGT